MLAAIGAVLIILWLLGFFAFPRDGGGYPHTFGDRDHHDHRAFPAWQYRELVVLDLSAEELRPDT
jgi:hypothetical protein